MTAPPTPAVTRVDEIRLRPVVTVAPDAPLDQVARITPDTVFVRLQRITIDAPENWLGRPAATPVVGQAVEREARGTASPRSRAAIVVV